MTQFTASDYRLWANQCANRAARTSDPDARARLLKMKEALEALAASEDWLAGTIAARNDSDAEIASLTEQLVGLRKTARKHFKD